MHPLDPLTGAEITQVANLVRAQTARESLHFKQISIIEPPKSVLRNYLVAERNGRSTLAPPIRCASALYYHRGTANLFLARINLNQNHVEDIKQLESHFHGQADIDEAVELRDICLKHPKVLEEIRKFKLPDHLTVVCDTWPYGRDSEDNHPRYVQVRLYILERTTNTKFRIVLPFRSKGTPWVKSL